MTVRSASGMTSTLPSLLAPTKEWISDRVAIVSGGPVETKKDGAILLQMLHRVVETTRWHLGSGLTLFLHWHQRCVSFNDCRNISSIQISMQSVHPCDNINSLLLNMVIYQCLTHPKILIPATQLRLVRIAP